MAPILDLPLNLSGERQTELLKETITEIIADIEEWSDSIYSDGILPGTEHVPAAIRKRMYDARTDPADMELLIDDDYLLALQHGLARPPVSPFWLNAVSSQGTFERLRRDYLRLIHQTWDQKRVSEPK